MCRGRTEWEKERGRHAGWERVGIVKAHVQDAQEGYHRGGRQEEEQEERQGPGTLSRTRVDCRCKHGMLTPQRGVVGADLASILAKRTAKPEVRAAARQAAITKAKSEKREKEATKQSTKSAGGANVPKVSKQSMKGGAGKGGR